MNKPACLRPGTVVRANEEERLQKYYLSLVCMHIVYTQLMRGVTLPTAIGDVGIVGMGGLGSGLRTNSEPVWEGEIESRDRPAVARRAGL